VDNQILLVFPPPIVKWILQDNQLGDLSHGEAKLPRVSWNRNRDAKGGGYANHGKERKHQN